MADYNKGSSHRKTTRYLRGIKNCSNPEGSATAVEPSMRRNREREK
ncbi:hypothetical protein H4I95_01076 [Botrytis cinerea]